MPNVEKHTLSPVFVYVIDSDVGHVASLGAMRVFLIYGVMDQNILLFTCIHTFYMYSYFAKYF